MRHFSELFLAFGLILGWLLPRCVSGQSSSDWIFKHEKDNVKVFYRRTADVHEIKLTTSIQTHRAGLVHLLAEVEQYPNWGYKVVESKLLRKIAENEIIYYSKVDFPWPLADRDVVLHSTFHIDPLTKIATSTSVALPDYLPEKKDVVRMRTTKTIWKMWPSISGWTYLEYYIYSDPGGNMPDWLVNMGLDMGPRETIKRMRSRLRRPEYQAIRLAQVLD